MNSRHALIMLASCPWLGGCAPTVSAFGAYFPGWLLCALIGLAGAAIARVGFVVTGLSDKIPAQFFVCAAIGIIIASLCWLIGMG